MITLGKELNRINTLVGFSIKSRKIIFGFDALEREKRKSGIGIIIIDSNVSLNTKEKAIKWADTNKCKLWILSNWEELTTLKPGIKVVAVLKGDLCDAINSTFLREIEESGSEYVK